MTQRKAVSSYSTETTFSVYVTWINRVYSDGSIQSIFFDWVCVQNARSALVISWFIPELAGVSRIEARLTHYHSTNSPNWTPIRGRHNNGIRRILYIVLLYVIVVYNITVHVTRRILNYCTIQHGTCNRTLQNLSQLSTAALILALVRHLTNKLEDRSSFDSICLVWLLCLWKVLYHLTGLLSIYYKIKAYRTISTIHHCLHPQ